MDAAAPIPCEILSCAFLPFFGLPVADRAVPAPATLEVTSAGGKGGGMRATEESAALGGT